MAGIQIYTSEDVTNIKAALIEIASRGAAEVEINGRIVKYTSITALKKLLEDAVASVNSAENGGIIDVKFMGVC